MGNILLLSLALATFGIARAIAKRLDKRAAQRRQQHIAEVARRLPGEERSRR